ncbi:uncharacterized protein [Onthophagus taurus]|uniref:uncharacterized protein isoform X2 n=1 Tax=Onthophagus taurus TaxID=166361 RepID=UPI0039BE12F0
MFRSSPYSVLILLLFELLVAHNTVNGGDGGENVSNVKKGGDVDLKTCIDNFAVHKDKIIRTQDSRAMGAKYLHEIDLDTREECLRLCCETENCDVFIYEEKSVGSCYLFECGPPEDFKCKFTHHANYSSGVLTVNRHLPDLESQIKLTKHEEDLTKLRKPEVPSPGSVQIVSDVYTTTPTTTTTVKNKEVLEAKSESGKCKRFQFECRSNSECIAIYNACDGIPQCSDGSDEAPELGCPQEIPTTLPPSTNINNRQVINVQTTKVDEIERSRPSLVANPPPNQEQYHSFIPRQNIPVIQSQEEFVRSSINDQRNGQIVSKVQLDSAQMPQFPQYVPPQSSSNWIQHQSAQIIPQPPQYGDKNSHIFNHKANGLQVPEGLETSPIQQQYGEINTHDYPKYYGDAYRQPIQQVLDNWPQSPPAGISYRTGPFPPQLNPPQIAIPQKTPQESSIQNWDAEEEKNPQHVQDKMAHELKQHSKEQSKTIVRKDNEQKVAISANHERSTSKFVVADVIAERLEMKDGLAEAPGGAILSLTLGLIITCLMAILIGCRLRVVRRRMRRGGKSYAHDADYLVNGMYL